MVDVDFEFDKLTDKETTAQKKLDDQIIDGILQFDITYGTLNVFNSSTECSISKTSVAIFHFVENHNSQCIRLLDL